MSVGYAAGGYYSSGGYTYGTAAYPSYPTAAAAAAAPVTTAGYSQVSCNIDYTS